MLDFLKGNGPTQSPSHAFSQEFRELASQLLTKIDNELAMLRENDLGGAAEAIQELERIVTELRVELTEFPKG